MVADGFLAPTLLNLFLRPCPSGYVAKDIIMSKIGSKDRNDKDDPFIAVSLGRLAYLYRNVSLLLKLTFSM